MNLKKLKGKDTYITLLSLIAFTIPMSMLFNNIALIAFLVFWLISCFRGRICKSNIKGMLVLITPYLLIVLGSIYSSDIHQVKVELIKGLPFLMLPLVIFTLPYKVEEDQLKTIFKSFITGTGLICVFLLMVILRTAYAETLSVRSLWGLTHQSLSSHVELNAIYLSLFITICLSILLFYYFKTDKILSFKRKVTYALVAVLFFVILIFLSSRTVIIGCLTINSTMFLFFQLKRYSLLVALTRFMIITSLLLLATFLANPILKWRVESMFDIQDKNISSDGEQGIEMRDKLWTSSIEVIKKNWLIGVGTGDYKIELEKVYRENDFRVQYRHHMNSHNQYLSYAVSHGLIGLLLFVFYLIYCLFLFQQGKFKLPIFLTLTFVICFVTESYLYTNKGIIIVVFLMTVLSKSALDTLEISSDENA